MIQSHIPTLQYQSTMTSSKSNTTNAIEDMFDFHDDKDNNKYIEAPWSIINSYFKGNHLDKLVRHQLESYNNFVNYQIIKTIDMFNPVNIASEQDFDAKSGKHALEICISQLTNIY